MSTLNFPRDRYFDIEGSSPAESKAMTHPCGRIRIPINESTEDKSQIQNISRPITARHQHMLARHGDIITPSRRCYMGAVPDGCPTPLSAARAACRAMART